MGRRPMGQGEQGEERERRPMGQGEERERRPMGQGEERRRPKESGSSVSSEEKSGEESSASQSSEEKSGEESSASESSEEQSRRRPMGPGGRRPPPPMESGEDNMGRRRTRDPNNMRTRDPNMSMRTRDPNMVTGDPMGRRTDGGSEKPIEMTTEVPEVILP